MNEMLPWGLTLGQSLFLAGGAFGVFFAFLVLKNAFKIAGTALLLIIAMLLGCLFCSLAGFYLVNA